MEIKGTLDDFIKIIRNTGDIEVAKKAIKSYADGRVEDAIKSAWRKANKFWGKVAQSRNKRLRDITLEWSQENDYINMVEFTDWFSSVEDQLLEIALNSKHEETKEALALVVDEMYSRIGRIKIDRRNLFQKRAKEEKIKEKRKELGLGES